MSVTYEYVKSVLMTVPSGGADNEGVYENTEREWMKEETKISFPNFQWKSLSVRLTFIKK